MLKSRKFLQILDDMPECIQELWKQACKLGPGLKRSAQTALINRAIERVEGQLKVTEDFLGGAQKRDCADVGGGGENPLVHYVAVGCARIWRSSRTNGSTARTSIRTREPQAMREHFSVLYWFILGVLPRILFIFAVT